MSPNGPSLAYRSNESDRFEVFVRPFPTSWQMADLHGRRLPPSWFIDGTEIVLQKRNGADGGIGFNG